MTCIISNRLLDELSAHLEKSYPDEGAGFLLGSVRANEEREIEKLILLENNWPDGPRDDRFLLTPQDVLAAEEQADAQALTLLGVFHSHPDDINIPSEFDREWALPWFSYMITSVAQGQVVDHRLWKLCDDRSAFIEETLEVSK